MKIRILAAALLAPALSCHGALYYTIATDSSGSFIEGGYSPDPGGGGTVQTSAGGVVGAQNTLVDNFSSGTFDMGRTAVAFTGFGLLGGQAGSLVPTPLGSSVHITMNGAGATADFDLRNPAGFGVPASLSDAVISDMQNVTSFDVEWTWTEPLAAPLGGSPIAFGPFLTGLANITTIPLEVDLEFLGLAHTLDGMTTIPGLPATADAIDLQDTAPGNAWPTGATSHTFNLATGGNWEGIMGFDLNGGAFTGVWPSGSQGDGVLQDVEQVYATGFRATVRPSGGATMIPNGSEFVFSTNGNQWSDTIEAIQTIPEPSRGLLLLIGSLVLVNRRRR